MSIYKIVVASDHLDRHNEIVSPEALRSMVQQINAGILPSYFEHDYRFPPIGRVENARLHLDNEGHTYVMADLELFDSALSSKKASPTKSLVTHDTPIGKAQVAFDRTYDTEDYQELVMDVQRQLDSELMPITEGKKALEPMSWLTLGFGFVAGAVASGFFNKLGQDIWDKLKKSLSAICEKRRQEDGTFVIDFLVTVHDEKTTVEARVMFTNPEYDDIKEILPSALQEIEKVLQRYKESGQEVRKLAWNVAERELRFSYAVDLDGIPVDVDEKAIEEYGEFISMKARDLNEHS
ncbi:MAG: hypothetical protein HN368_12540 [Spirochaetales bacterium]|jgi:hypothetical protein|nr:hypothetical protein [Spirochaetales bacterium]